MESKAVLKHMRVSPRKARLVIDLIRGKGVETALGTLEFNTKAISTPIATLLKSAIANAENNMNLDVDKLYIKSAFVDGGPTMKRMRPRAMGRGNTIRKRTSHITIVLDEK
jgi:large subunit ribosomal protein L22